MNYGLILGIIVGVLLFFIIVLSLLSLFFPVLPSPFNLFWQPQRIEEEKIKRQLDELNTLKSEFGIKEPTEKDIQTQVEELEALKGAGTKPPSSELELPSPPPSVPQQLNELQKLREQSSQ